jgi:hypothetical protein
MIQAILTPPASPPLEADHALAPDTALVLLEDGTGRLLDLGGNFYALPGTAAGMLRDILRAGSTAAADRIAARHGVEVARVRQDLSAFLDSLARSHLVRRAAALADPNKPSLAPSASVRRALGWLHRLRSPRKQSWALLVLAYLSIRLLGWPRTVATWRTYHERLPNGRSGSAADLIQATEAAVRAVVARHPLPVACKERALCCWSLLRAAGVPARLVVGVDFFPFASHCWCEAGGDVVGDFADRCERYTPVFIYD